MEEKSTSIKPQKSILRKTSNRSFSGNSNNFCLFRALPDLTPRSILKPSSPLSNSKIYFHQSDLKDQQIDLTSYLPQEIENS